MGFVEHLNNNILLLVFLMSVTYIIGFKTGSARGGWNRHLCYFWSLIILLQYTLVTPLFFYLNGRKTIIGSDISHYYGIGFFFNWLALLSFIIGYWIMPYSRKERWNNDPGSPRPNMKKILNILFYSIYAIVLINMAVGGVNIRNVFLGNEQLGFGASGATYYFQNFTDSLITILLLAYLYKIPRTSFVIWLLASFFLFSLLGFRYRILLTLFGILFIFFYRNRPNVTQITIGVFVSLAFYYVIMFSSVNRFALITRNYDDVEYNPAKYDYSIFFDQTRGALADMAVYKLYDNPNKITPHDYGLSIFGYILIRMLPRSLVPDKDKFYPPPQGKIAASAYDAWWAKYSGEATLNVSALYIAFGWMGILFGHFFWAFFLRKFSNLVLRRDLISFSGYIVIALVSFQWITRGYFPQEVDHFVYMMFPIWIIRFFAPKKKSQPELNKTTSLSNSLANV